MSSNVLYRLSGLGLLIGGSLAAIGNVLANVASSPSSPVSIAGYALSVTGAIFIVICFVGVYLRQASRAGSIGLLGFLLLLLSRLTLAISYGVINLVIVPSLIKVVPSLAHGDIPGTDGLLTIGAVASILGVILFSIASIRAAVFPRWIPLVLVVGFILNTVVEFLGLSDFGVSSVLFQLAFASFGYVLLAQSRRKEEQATFSSAILSGRG